MSNVIDRMPVDEAVSVLLEAGVSFPIGRARAPSPDGDDQDVVTPPYAIVYPITGGSYWGPEWTTTEDAADLMYQVTSVGLRGDQAQWAADAVRQTMLDRDNRGRLIEEMLVTGVYVLDRESGGPPGGVTSSGKIFSVADIYTVKVSLR